MAEQPAAPSPAPIAPVSPVRNSSSSLWSGWIAQTEQLLSGSRYNPAEQAVIKQQIDAVKSWGQGDISDPVGTGSGFSQGSNSTSGSPIKYSDPSSSSANTGSTFGSTGGSYTIQAGEGLETIAMKLGTTTGILMKANGIENADKIQAGQVLKVPSSADIQKGDSIPAEFVRIVQTEPFTPTQNTDKTKESADRWIKNLEKDLGVSHTIAVGIVANLAHESWGMNPAIKQGGRLGTPQELSGGAVNESGFGICQWGEERRAGLISYATAQGLPPGSEAAQYGFIRQELQTQFKSHIEYIKSQVTGSGEAAAKQAATLFASGGASLPLPNGVRGYLAPSRPDVEKRLSWIDAKGEFQVASPAARGNDVATGGSPNASAPSSPNIPQTNNKLEVSTSSNTPNPVANNNGASQVTGKIPPSLQPLVPMFNQASAKTGIPANVFAAMAWKENSAAIFTGQWQNIGGDGLFQIEGPTWTRLQQMHPELQDKNRSDPQVNILGMGYYLLDLQSGAYDKADSGKTGVKRTLDQAINAYNKGANFVEPWVPGKPGDGNYMNLVHQYMNGGYEPYAM